MDKNRKNIAPPIARIVPKVDNLHGKERVDNYFWLRERDNPEVIEYLEAENEYTEDLMKHTGEFQKQLYKELLGRIKETDLSVPVKMDDYYYYTRTEEGKQYRIHCRKKGSLEAEEEVLWRQLLLKRQKQIFLVNRQFCAAELYHSCAQGLAAWAKPQGKSRRAAAGL